jgi:Glyoxalase/Bleomycin resistance protein/Dioxygenase superfamily
VFDHMTIRVEPRVVEALLRPRLRGRGVAGAARHGGGFIEWNDLSLAQASPERPATRRLHVAFVAPTRKCVDGFRRALTAAGHPDDGAPGLRPQYSPDYYGAFVLDPDGNSVEAVHHRQRAGSGQSTTSRSMHWPAVPASKSRSNWN